jgi:hypothetical protein
VEREALTPGPEHSGHIIRLLLAVVCPIAILGGVTASLEGQCLEIKNNLVSRIPVPYVPIFCWCA